MRVKVLRARFGSYWYANSIGKIFNVSKAVDGDYVLKDKVRWICKDDCRPLKAAEARKPASNSDYTTALWRELRRRQGNGSVPKKTDWVAVTKERLNAALKAARHCA